MKSIDWVKLVIDQQPVASETGSDWPIFQTTLLTDGRLTGLGHQLLQQLDFEHIRELSKATRSRPPGSQIAQ